MYDLVLGAITVPYFTFLNPGHARHVNNEHTCICSQIFVTRNLLNSQATLSFLIKINSYMN